MAGLTNGYDVRMRAVLAALVLACTPVLAGCAAADRPDVDSVVTHFYDAYDRRDGATACSLLAPAARQEVEQASGVSCSRGLLQEHLPRAGSVSRTTVSGDQAQVRLGGDTAFVAKFPGGWKVVAVGCSPKPGRPYDCQVEAG
jgi:hypothetical protein